MRAGASAGLLVLVLLAAAPALADSAYDNLVLASSPVLYYPSAANGNALAGSPNASCTGTVSFGTTITPFIKGVTASLGCLAATASGWNLGGSSGNTLEAWLLFPNGYVAQEVPLGNSRPTSYTQAAIVTNGAFGIGSNFTSHFYDNAGSDLSTTGQFNGQPVYWVANCTAGFTCTIYINNVSQGTTTWAYNDNLGQGPNLGWGTATVAVAAIASYNSQLSGATMTAHYNCGLLGTGPACPHGGPMVIGE